MRGPFALLLFGFAAMFGPLVGASMPWASRVHAWVFGAPAEAAEGIAIGQLGIGQLGHVAPHLAFAFTGVALGIAVAWTGMVWAGLLLLRHGWPVERGE